MQFAIIAVLPLGSVTRSPTKAKPLLAGCAAAIFPPVIVSDATGTAPSDEKFMRPSESTVRLSPVFAKLLLLEELQIALSAAPMPSPTVRMLLLAMMPLVLVRLSVPSLTVTAPEKVLAPEPPRISVPAPAFVRPCDPAIAMLSVAD